MERGDRDQLVPPSVKFYEVKLLLQSEKSEAEVEQMVAQAIEVLAVKAKRLSWDAGKAARRRSGKRP